jgi:hypothetical protein
MGATPDTDPHLFRIAPRQPTTEDVALGFFWEELSGVQ